MKIRGSTVGTPAPRPDWYQTNPRGANYIINKPNISKDFVALGDGTMVLGGERFTAAKLRETIDYVASESKGRAGIIYPLATANVPKGFLLCDGAEYGRTDYAELFEAIGTVYGEGDGETTFNVPNLSTRVPVGAGDGYELGKVGGKEKHTLTVDEMPSHTHSAHGYVYGSSSWGEQTFEKNTIVHDVSGGDYHSAGYTANASSALIGTALATGGDKPHNNMQPYTVVNYIISTGKEVEFVVGGKATESVILDDSVISEDKLWSSKNTVDKLCPSFTENIKYGIIEDNLDGYPLHVLSWDTNVVHLGKNLAGHYDFNNAKGVDRVISCKDGVYTAEFTADRSTAMVLTTEADAFWKNRRFPPGNYTFSIKQEGTDTYDVCYAVAQYDDGSKEVVNGYPKHDWWTLSGIYCSRKTMKKGTKISFTLQIEAGNKATDHEPCQKEVFSIGEPHYNETWGEYYAVDEDVIPYEGGNMFFAEDESTSFTVTGKADPTKVIEKLTNAIVALGGNV